VLWAQPRHLASPWLATWRSPGGESKIPNWGGEWVARYRLDSDLVGWSSGKKIVKYPLLPNSSTSRMSITQRKGGQAVDEFVHQNFTPVGEKTKGRRWNMRCNYCPDSAPLIVHRDSRCLLHLSGVDCKNAPGDVKATSFCARGQNCCFFDSPASPALAPFPRQCTRLAGEWRVLLDHRPSTLPEGPYSISWATYMTIWGTWALQWSFSDLAVSVPLLSRF